MAILDEITTGKEKTTIDEMIALLERIKSKHGNIAVTLQYQDDGGAYDGHTNGIYALYVESEDNGEPVVVLE